MSDLHDSAFASPLSPDPCARVRVGDCTTRYLRRGVGRPVVVLRATDCDGELWPPLLDAIAAHHRLILPEAPCADAAFASWFRGFADGIGLPPATMIAADAYCVPALELALLEPERLDRLVLVPRGRAEESGVAGSLSTAARQQALPILVVRRGHPASDALATVERFIAEDPS
ncbi:MAG TPA: hypothetical protein VF041_14670 [Gemmatimonadaceae bacterium]